MITNQSKESHTNVSAAIGSLELVIMFNESSSSPPCETFGFCFLDRKFHIQAIIGLKFLLLIGSPGGTKEDLTAEPVVEPLRSLTTKVIWCTLYFSSVL